MADTRPLVLSALLGLALVAGCGKKKQCTAEVTEGAGTFTGRRAGGEPEAELKREALREACQKLCEARKDAPMGCASRCAVDAEVGKIGLKMVCEGGR